MKRTYSRRNMTTKPEEGDSRPEMGQKRRKKNIQSEFKPINTLTGNCSGKPTRRQFSPPISFQHRDSDLEMVGKLPSRGVLKRLVEGEIPGSAKSGKRHGPLSRAPASSSPKRYIDNHMGIQSIHHDKNDAKDHDGSDISAVLVSKPDYPVEKQKAQMATKKTYIPKTNEVVKSKQSNKDLLGRQIDPGSPQAYLWTLNQTASPLLRLPFELRNRVFELVLGCKTIAIDFKPYRVNGLGVVERTFKYTGIAYRGRINPFQERPPFQHDMVTTDLTLLNGVCRQLYHETEILPYKLNCWAFEKHLKMINFLLVDHRLTRKHRAAIQELLVTDQLPGDNMLKIMRGVHKVFLTGSATAAAAAKRGRYRVVKENGYKTLVHDVFQRGG